MFYRMLEEWRFAKKPKTTQEIAKFIINQFNKYRKRWWKWLKEDLFYTSKTLKSWVVSSPSVSMIIETPNNIERLFSIAFWPERALEIKEKFENFEEVELTRKEIQKLKSYYNLHVERISSKEELETIWEVFVKTWRLVCPHTANAICWLKKYRKKSNDYETKALVSETASPWKFLAAIAAALHYQTIDERKREQINISYIYQEYRSYESDITWKGINELIEKIKLFYGKLWKTFNLSDDIPRDLREIYENTDLSLWEIKSASDWNEVTSESVRKYSWKFKAQVTELIKSRIE